MFACAPSQRDRSRGLSLVEVLVTVSVLGILAALSVGLVASGIIDGTREAKLKQDQRTLNTAVAAYLQSGGDLSTASDAEEVILRLKARVSEEQRSRAPGVFGPFLDSAATLRMQDSDAAERGDSRLVWDAGSKRFLMASSGPPGISGLVLDEAARSTAGSDSIGQRDQIFEYASKGSWVWDYKELPVPAPLGPSFVPVSEAPENTTPYSVSSGSDPESPSAPEQGNLLPSEVSIPGGTYPIGSYPLSVLLSDPNPEGTASIYFRIDYASWQHYNGSPISIQPNQALQAQAIPLDPAAYSASALVEEHYKANPVTLAPPVIDISAPQFSADSPTVTVEITHDDAPENSRIEYRVDGGAWIDYAGPFVLSQSGHPEGATIEAVAIATSPFYLDSSEASASIGVAAAPRPEVFATFCASDLANHGVTILEGGRYRTSHSGSGVDGDVAIGPGGTWSISEGAVTGVFRIHPGTSGSLGNGTDQFGSGGDPIEPVTSDLAHLQEVALAVSAQAASLPATQTFSKIDSSTTLSATAPDGLNVVSVGEISLSGGNVLTLSGGPEDYFIVNISKGVKMSGGSTWALAGGLKSSNVLFNLLPGASEFGGSGSSEFSSAAIILAPHPGTKVVITGSSAIVGNVITATEFTATGGSRVLGVSCK